MARKRTRMRRDPTTTVDGTQQGHHTQPNLTVDGQVIDIRQLSPQDEGVLYTMKISERDPKHQRPRSRFSRIFSSFKKNDDDDEISMDPFEEKANPHADAPQSSTLTGVLSTFVGPSTGKRRGNQFTIKPKRKYNNVFFNWLDSLNIDCHHDVDNHLYKPSPSVFRYINWTFRASFTAVFFTFLVIYFALSVLFALLLMAAGHSQPQCIVVSGDHFGTTETKWSDAFALSWTTFTTVGYGMTYTTTGNDFAGKEPKDCSAVVFLCNAEAFMGLLFAGMCGAILFGKVNRIQSHANVIFSNAVCLQYEELDPKEYFDNDGNGDDNAIVAKESKKDDNNKDTVDTVNEINDDYSNEIDIENGEKASPFADLVNGERETKMATFTEQFNGCPVLKFQVVNELANKEGSELVDTIMKVVGVKYKRRNGKIVQSQYVRVNLVDFEHPFFSRVWHGVHILDATSPLLKNNAKRLIKQNGGAWPSDWFKPDLIDEVLDFDDLIITVAGISNVSAVTVHNYKRYKKGDVLIGFNYAPLVFQNKSTGQLEVDLALAHDVREQRGGGGEDLRASCHLKRHNSTIRIKSSKSIVF